MNKSIRSVVFFIVLIIPILTYGQVGIGTETPTQEFEIKGSIKLLDLESNSPNLVRQLKSDDQGNLITEVYEPKKMYFKKLIKKSMNPVVVNVNQEKELGMRLVVEIEPRSEATIILSYNIPIYFNGLLGGTHSTLPLFGGVKMLSSKKGYIVEGNRCLTFPIFYEFSSSRKGGIYLEGKYVEVIRNPSYTNQDTVTYWLNGYTTGAAKAIDANFGDIAQEGSFGVGVFSCQVFNKFL